MSEATITVRGTAREQLSPERARVRAEVSIESPARDDAYARATASAALVRAALTELATAPGILATWSSDTLRLWSARPWSETGEAPLQHTAQITFEAVFAELTALPHWLDTVAEIDGMRIAGIGWELSPESHTAALTRVRANAVADAVDKASAYAHSVGLSTVTATAIADSGMLDGAGSAPELGGFSRAMMHADAAGSGIEMRPSDVEVTASVDIRFAAR